MHLIQAGPPGPHVWGSGPPREGDHGTGLFAYKPSPLSQVLFPFQALAWLLHGGGVGWGACTLGPIYGQEPPPPGPAPGVGTRRSWEWVTEARPRLPHPGPQTQGHRGRWRGSLGAAWRTGTTAPRRDLQTRPPNTTASTPQLL